MLRVRAVSVVRAVSILSGVDGDDDQWRVDARRKLWRSELVTVEEVLSSAEAGSLRRRIAEARAIELRARLDAAV